MSRFLSISEAAAHSGISTDTLRYYEKLGLVDRIQRGASSGHRVYREADLEWLRFLQRLRATGMPIAGMLHYAQLRREGQASVGARRALLQAHAQGVAAEIQRLQGLLAGLHEKIALYQAMETQDMASSATPEKAKRHVSTDPPGHPPATPPARQRKTA